MAGKSSDSTAFDGLYEPLLPGKSALKLKQFLVMDAGYNKPWIMQKKYLMTAEAPVLIRTKDLWESRIFQTVFLRS